METTVDTSPKAGEERAGLAGETVIRAGEAAATVGDPDVRTFRGRSVDEILPQVRAELGPDAIVLRRREGLAGGVAGFFQRPFAEVDARVAHADELRVGGDSALRNDRATAEGLASPAIQALVEQASPFAAALTRAVAAPDVADVRTGTGGETPYERAQDVLLAAAAHGAQASMPAPAPVAAGLYGPQPNHSLLDDDDLFAVPQPFAPSPALPAAEPAHAPVGPARPAAADAAVARLVTAGLSQSLAADVVGEAVTHGLPFAQPRGLKKLIRTALARRMPVMSDLGDSPRTLAFVGAGGAGKTAAIAKLAAAYAAADAAVVVVALRTPAGGCDIAARLVPLGVSVIAAADAEEAARRLARRDGVLTLIDTAPAGPGDRAAVATLAADLRALAVDEVHLTVPATLSAAAGDELAAAMAPVGVTHIALTHIDQTARPGAPVELAITGRRALSYAVSGEGIEPVDPFELARRLLP
jgi:flagellar biosynthesis GTPase FlhF